MPIAGAREAPPYSTTSFLDLAAPTVSISKYTWEKLQHWVKKGASHECSGMGKVVVEPSGRLVIVDAWMVKQTNSGAETEMDADDFGRIMFQRKDVPGSWYFWWHSHASMPCFWSGTDRDQIVKLANNGACVALVLNTRGESKLCLAIGKPFLLYMDDVKIDIFDPAITGEQRAEWDAEYDAKVSPKWAYGGPSAGNWDWWNEENGSYHHPDRSYLPDANDQPFHSRYRNSQSSAVGETRTEIARGSLPQEKETTREEAQAVQFDEQASTLAWERLREIQREVEIIDFTLRERKVTKAFCEIIEVIHEPHLEVTTEITGAESVGYTLEDSANDKLVELFEEEDVIQEAIARYTASRQFTKEK